MYTESSWGVGEAVLVKWLISLVVKLLFSNSLRVNNIWEVRRVSEGYGHCLYCCPKLEEEIEYAWKWLGRAKTALEWQRINLARGTNRLSNP